MLTPDDIVNYPLKQSVRGYSVAQVDDLLDQVADTIEELERRLGESEERLRRAEEQLVAATETEGTLKRTLVTAQRAAEQSLEEAKERAATIVEEARREADAARAEVRREVDEQRAAAEEAARIEDAERAERRAVLEDEIASLRTFERRYRSQLRGQLEDHLRRLDETPTIAAPLQIDGSGDGPVDRSGADDGDEGADDLTAEVAELLEAPGERHLTVRVRDDVVGAPSAGARVDRPSDHAPGGAPDDEGALDREQDARAPEDEDPDEPDGWSHASDGGTDDGSDQGGGQGSERGDAQWGDAERGDAERGDDHGRSEPEPIAPLWGDPDEDRDEA